MKLKLVGITLALLVVVVLAAPKDELIAGTRTAAANLYKALIEETANDQNVIFSPLSVQTIMGLLTSAATDDNKEVVRQIITGMSLPSSEHNRQIAFKNVLGTLKADNDFKAFDATKMYFTPGYSVKDWYGRIVENVYGVEIDNVDFGNARTTQIINEWVARKTDNGITNFIKSGDITSNTKNFMINTLYLKGKKYFLLENMTRLNQQGKWFKPFESKNNVNTNFNSPTGTRQVTMMTALKSYDYFEDNDAQYLKLDLVRDGGRAEMVVVLPKQQQGLSTLEDNVENLLREVTFSPEMVQLALPKFSFNQNIELKTVLQNMGIRNIFRWGGELEGLKFPGHGGVKITDVFQKAFISVDEWGVTAGATSGAKIIVDLGQGVKTFTADHPFLFYIAVEDAILYAGRVMQP